MFQNKRKQFGISFVIFNLGAVWAFNCVTPENAFALAGESSVIIQKAPTADLSYRDFEVVSGSDDVVGDPVAGFKESYATWKAACADWKKQVRELNSGTVLSLNCGSPVREEAPGGAIIHKSLASYKLRVRVRDGKGGK